MKEEVGAQTAAPLRPLAVVGNRSLVWRHGAERFGKFVELKR